MSMNKFAYYVGLLEGIIDNERDILVMDGIDSEKIDNLKHVLKEIAKDLYK